MLGAETSWKRMKTITVWRPKLLKLTKVLTRPVSYYQLHAGAKTPRDLSEKSRSTVRRGETVPVKGQGVQTVRFRAVRKRMS